MSRPLIVYLDQNHWISVAQAIHSPAKVRPPTELEPALEVARLAGSGVVQLVISAGHAVETAHAGDSTRRRELATTMLSLASRCFLTSPVSIRRAELRRLFRGQAPMLPTELVFRDDPRFVFADRLPDSISSLSPIDRIFEIEAFATAFLSAKPTAAEQALTSSAVNGWIDHLQALTDWLAANPSPRDLRMVAAGKTFADLGNETAEEAAAAGIDVPRFDDVFRVESIVESIESMPLVSRTMGIVEHRLRNAQKKWESNDLNDIFFLSAAAAYGDVVVGERFCIDLLRRSQVRTGPGANLFSNLSDAIRYVSHKVKPKSLSP